MQVSPEFKLIVELYRQLNCPTLKGERFAGSLMCLEETEVLLKSLWECKKFDIEIDVDNEAYDTDSEEVFPKEILNKNIIITVSLPQTENGKFYESLHQWVATAEQLNRGSLTPNTYLIKENLLVGEANESAELNSVIAICKLTQKLGEIAHYHDEKIISGPFRLVFVVPSKEDKSFYPVVLETKLSTKMLEYQPDVSIIENIIEEQANNRLHALERIATFRIALAEIIKKSSNDKETFTHLVCHWNEVLDNFQKSWESYINGFSFQKLKAEIAEKQTSFSQKMTDVIAGLSTKLFSLPVAIAGVAILEKQDSIIANWFYVAGSFLTTILMLSAIKIQETNLNNIKSGCDLAFSEYHKEENKEFSGIKQELKVVVDSLNDTTSELKKKLKLYRWLSWIPFWAAMIYIGLKSQIHFGCVIHYLFNALK
ncbi:MAG: hypothetical protein M0R33_00830 [Methylomonas sp.]|jgi:hypothetical protein|uniref:hypothetical protein n=1 Tax=Methylomonas sp. TaxID=418 RepID=UPI0025DA1C31|nr:hypothetical protein [Methylomonas sp.]MCK9604976.1 hypothetical protein [Methylomonas sp.]